MAGPLIKNKNKKPFLNADITAPVKEAVAAQKNKPLTAEQKKNAPKITAPAAAPTITRDLTQPIRTRAAADKAAQSANKEKITEAGRAYKRARDKEKENIAAAGISFYERQKQERKARETALEQERQAHKNTLAAARKRREPIDTRKQKWKQDAEKQAWAERQDEIRREYGSEKNRIKRSNDAAAAVNRRFLQTDAAPGVLDSRDVSARQKEEKENRGDYAKKMTSYAKQAAKDKAKRVSDAAILTTYGGQESENPYMLGQRKAYANILDYGSESDTQKTAREAYKRAQADYDYQERIFLAQHPNFEAQIANGTAAKEDLAEYRRIVQGKKAAAADAFATENEIRAQKTKEARDALTYRTLNLPNADEAAKAEEKQLIDRSGFIGGNAVRGDSNIPNLEYMNEEEKKAALILYHESPAKAKEYGRMFNAEKTEAINKNLYELTEKHPIVGGIAGGLISEAMFIPKAAAGAMYTAQNAGRAVLGKDAKAPQDTSYMWVLSGDEAIKRGMKVHMNELASFMLDCGFSVADSFQAALVNRFVPNLGTAMMASASAGQSGASAYMRGGTAAQVALSAAAGGAAEYLTETVQISNLSNLLYAEGRLRGIARLKNLLKTGLESSNRVKGLKIIAAGVASQFGEEAREEMISSLATSVFDCIIMGDNSEYKQTIAQYMEKGMDSESARAAAIVEHFMKQPAMSGLAGGISGSVSGGIAAGVQVGRVLTGSFGGGKVTTDGSHKAHFATTLISIDKVKRLMEQNPEMFRGVTAKEVQERHNARAAAFYAASKAFNVNIAVADTQNGYATGAFDRKTNTVYLSPNATAADVARIAEAHELVHTVENTKAYKKLARLVIGKAYGGTNTEAFQSALNEIITRYAGAGETLSVQDGAKELVAEQMRKTYLNNPQALYAFVNENYRGLGKDFFMKLSDLAGKVLNIGGADSSASGDILRQFGYAMNERRRGQALNELADAYGILDKDAKKDTYLIDDSKYDYSKPFSEQIEDWKKGKIPPYDTLLVGETPKIYTDMGFNALPVTINQTHVDYAVNGTKDADHTFGNLLEQLPEALKKPIAVIKSSSHDNRAVVILDISVNGKETVVPIQIDGDGRQNNIRIDSNALVSIYRKANGVANLLHKAILEERKGNVSVFFADNKKANALLRRAGLQLPGGPFQDNGFIHSIRDEGSTVKLNFENVTQTQQFKRWFGDWERNPARASKVVNEDGTPKVVYHGSKSNFTVFDSSKGGQSNEIAKLGFWFTENEKGAKSFTDNVWYGEEKDGKVYSVYLDIKKPKIYETTDNSLALDGIKQKLSPIDSELSLLDSTYYFEDGRRFHSEKPYDRANRRNASVAEWDAFKSIVLNYDTETQQYYLSRVKEGARETVSADARHYLELVKQRKEIERQISELRYSDAYEKFKSDIYKTAGQSAEDANIAGTGRPLSNASKTIAKYVETLKKQGYDGIIIQNTSYDSGDFGDNNTQYVVFEPTQIKSATDNIGTFDKSNPDIRYMIPSPEEAAEFEKAEKFFNGEPIDLPPVEPLDTRYREPPKYSADKVEEFFAPIESEDYKRAEAAEQQRAALENKRLHEPKRAEDDYLFFTPRHEEKLTRAETAWDEKISKIDTEKMQDKEYAKEAAGAVLSAMPDYHAAERVRDSIIANYADVYGDKEKKVVEALLSGLITENEIPKSVDDALVKEVYAASQAAYRMQEELNSIFRAAKRGYFKQAEVLLADSDNFRILNGAALHGLSPDRVLELTANGNEKTKKAFLNELIYPMQKNSAKAAKYLKGLRKRVKDLDISTKRVGRNALSEDEAVQYIGEAAGNIRYYQKRIDYNNAHGLDSSVDKKMLTRALDGFDAFRKNNPDFDLDSLRKKAGAMQEIYDELYQKVNAQRILAGQMPFAYREGYFYHYTNTTPDSWHAWFGLGSMTDEQQLPTDIFGNSEYFTPGIAYAAFANKRNGDKAKELSVLRGFDQYSYMAADILYHTEDIQKFRALEKVLDEKHSNESVKERIQALLKAQRDGEGNYLDQIAELKRRELDKFGNLAMFFHEMGNTLANKKSHLDRGAERLFSAGAGKGKGRIYNGFRWVERQTRRNLIGYNVSAALSNTEALAACFSDVSVSDFNKAAFDMVKSLLSRDGFSDSSAFLQARENVENLRRTVPEKIGDAGFVLANLTDSFVSEWVTRAYYRKGLRKGMSAENAMQFADLKAAKCIGDRSKGMTPLIFKSKHPITTLLTTFQLEVSNRFQFIGDAVKEKTAEGGLNLMFFLLKYMLGTYLFDDLYEKITGRRIALDPIGIANAAAGRATGKKVDNVCDILYNAAQGKGFTVLENAQKAQLGSFLQETGKDVLEQLPFIGGLAGGGRVPVSAALPDFNGIKQTLDSKTKSKGQKTFEVSKDLLLNPASALLLPGGGSQIKKTAAGVKALKNGGVYTNNGKEERLRYPVSDNFGNAAKGVLFGKSAFDENRQWVDSGFQTLSGRATKSYRELVKGKVPTQKAWELTKAVAYAKPKTDKNGFVQTTKKGVQREILLKADIPLAEKSKMDKNMVQTGKNRKDIDYGKPNYVRAIERYRSYDREKDGVDNLTHYSKGFDEKQKRLLSLAPDSEKGAEARRMALLADKNLSAEEKQELDKNFFGGDYSNPEPTKQSYAAFAEKAKGTLTYDKYVIAYNEAAGEKTKSAAIRKFMDRGLSFESAAQLYDDLGIKHVRNYENKSKYYASALSDSQFVRLQYVTSHMGIKNTATYYALNKIMRAGGATKKKQVQALIDFGLPADEAYHFYALCHKKMW